MTPPSPKAATGWQKMLPSRPFVIIIFAYLAGMILFTLLRGLFLSNYTGLVSGEPVSQVLTAFLIGLRFDQIIVLVALTPLLLLLPWIDMKRRVIRLAALSYLTLVFSFMIMLLLADIRFYNFFDSRLNFLAVEYIAEGSMFGDLIVTDPEFHTSVFIWLVLSLMFLAGLIFILRGSTSVVHRRTWPGQLVYLLVFLVLFALGIRGRIGLAPMDWGVAYFSQNNFLNQLALNGVYTLGRNLTETNREPRLSYLGENERFPLVELDTALATARQMLHTEGDDWLEPNGSLRRITHQNESTLGFKPNLVIILSESWSAEHTGALGSPRRLTPHFDRLADRGILFENFYASGTRTNFGISAIFCSFPALPGRAVVKRYNALHPFVTLSEILAGREYHNAFLYGGDLAFDNMEGFLRQKAFESFYGEEDFDRQQYFSKWGIPDHLLFDRAAALLDSLPRPFQLTVLTLSNHEPWDLPDSSVRVYMDDADSSKLFNSQIYADHSLGRFFASARSASANDSTIFVFVSDHGRYGPSPRIIEPRFFHIPLLIYAPSLLGDSAVRVSSFGSQTDILPTIMGLLGGDYEHASWGRNLLNLPPSDGGFAIMNLGSRLGYIDREFLYTEDLRGISGYGTRDISSSGQRWFGYALFESFDIIGKEPQDSSWVRLYANMLRPSVGFATRHVLGRLRYVDEGFVYIQGIGGRADSTDAGELERWRALFADNEPEGLTRSRRRLRHYVQAAEQLSTPAEP